MPCAFLAPPSATDTKPPFPVEALTERNVGCRQRAEEAGNAFVVGRIDRVQYSTEDVARFGDRLEVRAVVELKYRKAGILFHQSLWRPDGQRPLAWGCVTVYSIDKATKQPCPVSPEVEASLAAQLIAPPK